MATESEETAETAGDRLRGEETGSLALPCRRSAGGLFRIKSGIAAVLYSLLMGAVGGMFCMSCAGCASGVLNEGGAVAPPTKRWAYPPAQRGAVEDDYHGTTVADPYRWLEDASSDQTRAWVASQNELTRSFVRTPAREGLRARIASLWDYARYSLPDYAGERYFFWKNDGLQDQPVLYVQERLDAEPRVLLDPNGSAQDGTTAITGDEPSPDGRYLAYLSSLHGSDWQELRVRDVATGQDTSERLQRCKFTQVAWAKDSSGFFYNRFPDEDEVAPEDRNHFARVYWHSLGMPQAKDELVMQHLDDKELGFAPRVSHDGELLVLQVYRGTSPNNRLYTLDIRGGLQQDKPGAQVRRLFAAEDASYIYVGKVGRTLYMATDLDAPRKRVVAVDLDHPAPADWKTIVPEPELPAEVLEDVALYNGQLVVTTMRDASNRLYVYGLDGERIREIPLPGVGSVSGLSGEADRSEMFFAFTSFLRPNTSYRYDLDSGDLHMMADRAPTLPFDPDDFETTQVFVTSKDGTRVPVFLSHRRGLLKEPGPHPTMLYGYGGFNISLTPAYNPGWIPWLQDGGVYALANLRGGSEYGEDWHRAGMLEKKQNVFDDFIAAAEHLIQQGVTRPESLAISGGSNGGLLVAACMLQRPELFGAVLSRVPVTDMLRYHRFSVGSYWTPEYGDAQANAEHFRFLHAYSPVHNVRPGRAYPAILITTADTDDRVVPMHAKKFAAALQAADGGSAPLLLRVETKAGHGRGKPTSKLINEYADFYGFLYRALGIEPQKATNM